MDAMRRAVLDARSQANNDDEFIAMINDLILLRGQNILIALFNILAGLDLPISVAQDYWESTILHRKCLFQQLGRSMDLIPSMYDFLTTTPHSLHTPRLLEETSYSKVIMETTHDGLTGLFNRHYFNQALEQTVSSAKRYNSDVTLLFLDIDNFKDVNDTYGHKTGDFVLQQVTKTIMNEKRDSDIAARYGGEEIVVIMPHTIGLNGFIVAERMRKKIENLRIPFNDTSISITVSGGIATYPQKCKDHLELLHRADSALYLAKGSGKNIIATFKTEKRRYLRVKYEENIQIKELGFDSIEIFSGNSRDICIGGILFESNRPFKLGSKIEVCLPMPEDTPILLIGTVVRLEAFSRNNYEIGMAISFKEMEKIANREIAEYLQSTSPKDSG